MVHITVSGPAGSGTSTLSQVLMERYGYTHLNGGDVFRREAESRGLSLSSFGELCDVDSSVDTILDDHLRQSMLVVDGPDIVESRLSGWWAYQMQIEIPRICLHASVDARAHRVSEREGTELEVARKLAIERDSRDRRRLQELYGIDLASPEPYTLVLDTDGLSPEEVARQVMEHMEVVT
ncbi:MAG TPA: cytidylate kinase family protein [Candidatus Poseidoniales archaeon]|nr:cytidylate kinase family protein [Candidatus Poseidoniales archaeon]